MAVLILDCRMKMIPKVIRGRRNKITTVANKVRVVSVHCCSLTMMLPATSSSILTSVLDTGVTLPRRCVLRGKYKCLNCREYLSKVPANKVLECSCN
jgi:hypothetical protein